ncbi:calcium-binding protein [Nocardioides sp. MH1]|uniref:calcium-binding protein n=1 Tax=Nocardioides sp. MH1 TaxID=3242490 RepID=UPI0035219D87
MSRLGLAAVLVVVGSFLSADPPALSAGTPTCAGLAVTIDLADTDAPDPDRAASDVVLGTPGDDRIRTGAGDDVVCAGGGGDTIYLGAGDDKGLGGPGIDRLVFSEGDDVMIGGAGRDWIDYVDAHHGLSVDLGSNVRQDTGVGHDIVRTIENASGASHFANQVTGDCGPNFLVGGDEADYFHGLCGRDIIEAWRGNDRVWGGYGDDFVRGGYGADRLAGQQGDDELLGANGGDLLRGGPGTDVCDGGKGVDDRRACESGTR